MLNYILYLISTYLFHVHLWTMNPKLMNYIKTQGFCECSCGLTLSRDCKVILEVTNA